MTECLEYAADLNDTQPLPGFPSAMALRAENQKHFAKVLIEDVVVAMHSLEHLMAPLAENLKQCHLQDKFLPSLRLANRQFGNMVKSFYNSNLKDAKVPTTKRVSTGQSGVQVPIKALYNTYNRLKLIESVLGYYLDLSWFSRLESLAKEKKTLASQGE